MLRLLIYGEIKAPSSLKRNAKCPNPTNGDVALTM